MKTSLAVVPFEAPIPADARRNPAGFVAALNRLYEKRYEVVCPPVEVILSGRKPGRVLGSYKIKERLITINQKGMGGYTFASTLLHEYAHHVQHTTHLTEGESTLLGPGKSHGPIFEIQLARVRELAIDAGMLQPLNEVDEVISSVVERMKSLRGTAGETIIQIGEQLDKSRERCQVLGESFEDFLRNYVAFDRTTAYDYLRAFKMKISPSLTFTTMRFLMRIRDDAVRDKAMADAVDGAPLVTLRLRYAKPQVSGGYIDRLEALKAERKHLLVRVEEITEEIDRLNQKDERMVALTLP